MEKDVVQIEEEGHPGAVDEEVGGQSGRLDGRKSRLSGYLKIITNLPTKQVYFMDEQHLKLLKQGLDVSRGRIISIALERMMQDVAEGKFELRG